MLKPLSQKKISFRSSTLWVLCSIILLVCICFFKVPGFGFLIGWDDQWVVINQYTDQGLTISNITSIICEFYRGQYAPVNELYYTTLHSLFGYDGFWFHTGSIVIHILNTFLVFSFIRKVLPMLQVKGKHQPAIAYLASILFAIHPINLEPVAWLAASKIILYAFCYLLGLHTYLSYRQTNRPLFYFLAMVLFVISFGAKEQAVTFPVCLCLVDYVQNRPWKSRDYWIEKLPFFLLSLVFGMVTISSQGLTGHSFHYTYSISERLILVPYTISEYFTKCLLPVKLSFLYPFPFEPGQPAPWWLLIYPLLLAAPLIWLFSGRRAKWITFCIGFFFIHIAIGLNLVNLGRFAVVADRYAYLSTIGICLLVSCSFVSIRDRMSAKTAFIVVTTYIAYFSFYTFNHSSVWKNSPMLKAAFREVILTRPDYKGIQKIMEHEKKQ